MAVRCRWRGGETTGVGILDMSTRMGLTRSTYVRRTSLIAMAVMLVTRFDLWPRLALLADGIRDSLANWHTADTEIADPVAKSASDRVRRAALFQLSFVDFDDDNFHMPPLEQIVSSEQCESALSTPRSSWLRRWTPRTRHGD